MEDIEKTVFPKFTNKYTADMYLAEHELIIIPFINHKMNAISGLDLSGLKIEIKEYIVKWLIQVNERRLRVGLPLVVTYEILKVCPIWKAIGGMPYKRYSLDKKNITKIRPNKQNRQNNQSKLGNKNKPSK